VCVRCCCCCCSCCCCACARACVSVPPVRMILSRTLAVPRHTRRARDGHARAHAGNRRDKDTRDRARRNLSMKRLKGACAGAGRQSGEGRSRFHAPARRDRLAPRMHDSCSPLIGGPARPSRPALIVHRAAVACDEPEPARTAGTIRYGWGEGLDQDGMDDGGWDGMMRSAGLALLGSSGRAVPVLISPGCCSAPRNL
jgi:hypothetical protein